MGILYGEVQALPNVKNLASLLKKHAQARGDTVAVHDAERGTFVTFQELSKQSDQVARMLFAKFGRGDVTGVGKGKQITIGVLMEPSVERITAMLGIWMAGYAYCPLDINMPVSRVEHIVSETTMAAVVLDKSATSSSLPDGDNAMNWPNVFENNNVAALYIRELLEVDCRGRSATPCIDSKQGCNGAGEGFVQDLACIIYTSGSTGVPKGVQLTHTNILNRLSWQWKTFPFVDGERVAAKTSLLFVDSITELFGSLLAGTPIVIIRSTFLQDPKKLLRYMHEQQVSRIILVPSLLRNILLYASTLKESLPLATNHLKLVVCSGEVLPVSLLQKHFTYFPSVQLANFYGCTEITGDVTYQLFKGPEDMKKFIHSGTVSIGVPISNVNLYVLAENGDLSAVGEIGEVYISGKNVAAGYQVKRPDQEDFMSNRFCSTSGHKRLYKTGDFAEIIGGVVYYKGRGDTQVKIRGQRCDLKEIEAQASKVPGVDAAVCAVRTAKVKDSGFAEESKNILLFFTLSPAADCTAEEMALRIRTRCGLALASYMIPQDMVAVPEIPVTSFSKKTNRRALLASYEESLNRMASSKNAPDLSDPKTAAVVSILSSSAGILTSKLDTSKSFFEMGGTSATAMLVVAKLGEAGFNVQMADFLSFESLADLLNHIKRPIASQSLPATRPAACPLSKRFKIIDLESLPNTEESKDLIRTLVADCFAAKDVIAEAFGFDHDILKTMCGAELVWRFPVCVGALDSQTGELMAAYLAYDQDALGKHLQSLESIESARLFRLMGAELEQGATDHMKQFGKIIEMHMLATSLKLNPKENLELVEALELAALERAKRLKPMGYGSCISLQAHTVTAEVSSSVGYVEYNRMKMGEWMYQGKCILKGKCPDDYELIVSAIEL